MIELKYFTRLITDSSNKLLTIMKKGTIRIYCIINPLLANPGKLIQNIFQNFSFPGHEPVVLLENSSNIRAVNEVFKFIIQIYFGKLTIISTTNLQSRAIRRIDYRRNHIYTRAWVKYISIRRHIKFFFRRERDT